jgi:hypothetical protein
MPPEIARSMVNFGARGRDSLSNPVHVRFGSLADICTAIGQVRFTPESGHRWPIDSGQHVTRRSRLRLRFDRMENS